MFVRWQSDVVNTKKSILHVCEKNLITQTKGQYRNDEIEVLRNYALHAKDVG